MKSHLLRLYHKSRVHSRQITTALYHGGGGEGERKENFSRGEEGILNRASCDFELINYRALV